MVWQIRLGAEAEKDFARILRHTHDAFGPGQADIYGATLVGAIAALEEGPNILASASHAEILPDLRTLHVARQGRRGQHFILYRPVQGDVIEILRILHDAMDLARHAPRTS
jgi:toxin ParE1/3/4